MVEFLLIMYTRNDFWMAHLSCMISMGVISISLKFLFYNL